jgi:hypothetical protein
MSSKESEALTDALERARRLVNEGREIWASSAGG